MKKIYSNTTISPGLTWGLELKSGYFLAGKDSHLMVPEKHTGDTIINHQIKRCKGDLKQNASTGARMKIKLLSMNRSHR